MTPGPRTWRFDATVAAIAAVVLLAWDFSGLDTTVVRWFGRPDGFAWRDAWLTSTLAHQGGRLFAWALMAALVFDAVVRPLIQGPSRNERLRWLGATLACLVLVPSLKRASATSCPWDQVEFGGTAHHVSHWLVGVADGGPGHCFPSGHAVAAFAFVSVYFLLRDHRPVFARRWLAGVCAVGLLFGWAQLARGAHYPSHTLWSAWLCWAVCALVAALPAARRTAVAPPARVGAPPRG
jgi:membrane-associated PAP2 superfamily phosphatase